MTLGSEGYSMLGMFMLDGIRSNLNSTSVVRRKWSWLKLWTTKFSETTTYPNNLRAGIRHGMIPCLALYLDT